MLSSIIIQNIPTHPGVYIFKGEKDKVLYIGKAKNLQKRITQYFAPGSLRKQDMLAQASKLDFHVVQNESEALYLEDNLIKEHQPPFNNLLKADNSYAYIKITKEAFPQIFITRKKSSDGAIYIGPKHNTQGLKKFLQYIRQVLQYRGCTASQFRQGKLCSDYYFGICKGRCMRKNTNAGSLMLDAGGNKKSIPDSQFQIPDSRPSISVKEEYHEIINTITSFFKGNSKAIQHTILQHITTAVSQQNFERAAKLRDILQEIEGLTEQQTVVLSKKQTGYLIQVRQVGQRRIYLILYFFEGKLIDIIRHKEHINDQSEEDIADALKREFGPIQELKYDGGKLFSSLPSYTKKNHKELHSLSDKLFDSYIINSSFEETNLMNDLLSSLQKRYQLKNFPYRIECIDISHLSGGRVSGGLSCLLGGIAYPHGYRRYKIQSKAADDYASLKEVIERRFNKKKQPETTGDSLKPSESTLPDLLIIDGGKGQLNIIKDLYKSHPEYHAIIEKMDILSLGKGEARKTNKIGTVSTKGLVTEKVFQFNEKFAIHEQDLTYDEADKLLRKARDEAHRFANSYRKKQMSKEFK